MATQYYPIAPLEYYQHLTNAKYILGGYFVVDTYNELFADKMLVAESLNAESGTIIEGSLCYCREKSAFYFFNGVSWTTADIKIADAGGSDAIPTANLSYEDIGDVWQVSGDGITEYRSVVIPSVYEGKKVVKIASHAFDGCSTLETVTIPNTVEMIGEKAFHKCTSLKYVEIPDGVTDIGSNGGAVFEHCSNLEWVSIPKSVKIVGIYTFNGCTKATLYCEPAVRPDGWQVSGPYSWNPSCKVVWASYYEPIKTSTTISLYGSQYITSKGLFVEYDALSDSYEVKGIGGCTDTDLVIPPTYEGRPITSIGDRAFENCTNIRSVVIGSQVNNIGSYAFQNCTNLEKVTIPDGVKTIGAYYGGAFANCSSLAFVTIPKSVEKLGLNTFKDCPKAIIYCEAKSIPSGWTDNNLSGCTKHLGVNFSLLGDPAAVLDLMSKIDRLWENEKFIYELLFGIGIYEDVRDNVKIWLPKYTDKPNLYAPNGTPYYDPNNNNTKVGKYDSKSAAQATEVYKKYMT